MTKDFFRQSAASAELILAAALWGFGFIGVVLSLPSWAPTPLLFLRFAIGAVVGAPIVLLFARPKKTEILWVIKTSFLPAIFLATLLLLQTWGLLYTTATKSGFITVLYIVLVPILESVVARKKIPTQLWLCILTSLIGVYLIVDFSWNEKLNIGDFLTLLCAFVAALQIIALDRISSKVKNVFTFNIVQSIWSAFFLLLVFPFQDGSVIPEQMPTPMAWVGLISLALGSTLIAFSLQIRAQKVLSSTVSSLFFLLESPFALLFAFLLLGERLNLQQGLGAVLIMISALMATIGEKTKK